MNTAPPRSTPPTPPPPPEFSQPFSSTPRSARLARLLVSAQLAAWGHPHDTPANETVTLIAAELCANAVQHGRVPGRNFHVRLAADPATDLLRLEVTDTRTEHRPPTATPNTPPPEADSGRGLLLVATLADAWGVTDRNPGPGKVIWAEVRTAVPAHDTRPTS